MGNETACAAADKSSKLTLKFFLMPQLSPLHAALCIVPFGKLNLSCKRVNAGLKSWVTLSINTTLLPDFEPVRQTLVI